MTTTDLYGPITEAVLRLFPDYDQLADFFRSNLGDWLNRYTDRSKGLEKVAADIAGWAESRGETRRLIVQLHRRHPNDGALQTLLTELALHVDDFPALQATDFTGLQDAATNPLTQHIISPYKTDLQALSLTAVRIGGWKYLHDNVDLMRSLVTLPLTMIVKGPAQPGHRMEAMKLSTELGKRTTNITGRVREMKLSDRNIPWVAARLLPAQTSLQVALQQWPGMEQLAAAAEALGIVTSSDLTQLNGNIKSAAGNIEVLNIPEKLQSLQAALADGTADAKAAEQTDAEIRSMNQLVEQVLDLVYLHDEWQLLKDSFDNFATVDTVAAARDAWRHVNSKIGAITNKPADLVATHAAMAEAIVTDDFNAILGALANLNAVIANHFLAFDGDLLGASENLGKMGNGLTQVLEKIDA